MDPGVKVAAALSVLVTAICTALLFWGDSGGLAPPTSQPLKLRTGAEASGAVAPSPRKLDLFVPPLGSSANTAPPPTLLTPSVPQTGAPPCSTEHCPLPPPSPRLRNNEEHTSWGTAAGVKMPELRMPPGGGVNAGLRTHTVIDGDTLSDLARRYLGSADRHLEIYQWNSDVLAHPDMLPIGQLLRIPPRTSPPSEAAGVIERPLVPVGREEAL